tara:strand:- start:396 stop:602 length:207 start_codon:yes stop_codon:yes gene_type:complete
MSIKNGDMPCKKLFLSSWPSGDLILVEVLGQNKFIEGGIYIRYPTGGTDTTRERFLFDIPAQLEEKGK